ncbi:PAQR family membrane homeostasis protein TrhA [Solibacillus daqui]|uniref:PAQR family membrane homeostasis protein TrhA n=1 Tax=Solibacillus daqui TaxID=2912187 RepID=UPI00236542A7|nr:hemolysin III family protein [Solibacillus daqui]
MTQIIVEQSGYNAKEEFWNGLTHGIAALLTIPATIALIAKAQVNGSTVELVSYIIFGMSMFCLYLASTMYHVWPTHKTFLKKLDHSSIFLLIAGTYTPVVLIAIGGTLGWTIFAVQWGLAAIGIALKQFFVHRYMGVSLLVYIGMGWIIIFVFKPLFAHIGIAGILTLLAGGLSYTIGTYFYKNKNIPYNHAIWHLFVMGGSVAMYFAIYLYV